MKGKLIHIKITINLNINFVLRCFWIISFGLAVITAIYFIANLIHKWQDMPVIISLSPKATQLTNIPFPAITICNMNNARKSAAQNILDT